MNENQFQYLKALENRYINVKRELRDNEGRKDFPGPEHWSFYNKLSREEYDWLENRLKKLDSDLIPKEKP